MSRTDPFAGPRPDARFQVWLALLFLLLAVAGFTRSYLLKVAGGTFSGAPIFHLHGLLMFAWFGLYLLQALLASAGLKTGHRAAGLAGVGLFSALMCTTMALNLNSLQQALERARGAPWATHFPGATFITIATAVAFFIWAMSTTRRAGVHPRVMVLLMILLLQAAVSRLVVQPFIQGPPTVDVMQPTALATVPLLLLVLWRDWHVRGRPHPVYLWGGSAMLGIELLTPLLAVTGPVMRFTRAMGGLMG